MVEGSKPEYDFVVEGDIMVEMRDGVRLATDVYRPAEDGKPLPGRFPALLVRTPYDKSHPTRVLQRGEYFSRRGYVVVIQDCRGRYRSEGDFYIFVNEGPDGYDTVEWIARQPWSDGKVGTMGTSYMSWVQTSLAVQNPPHLRAMFPNQGNWNAHTSSVRQGGAFEMRWLGWAFFGAASGKEAAADPVAAAALSNVRLREWLTRTPLKEGHSPLRHAPSYEGWLFDLITHGNYDGFWRRPGLAFEEYVDQHSDVPTYCSGSWYDSYARSTVEMYTGLSETKRGPIRLIMGPWTHGMMELPYSGDVDFGPEAGVDWNALQLRWFDHWLKGMKTDIMDEPPVKIFVMGGGDGRKNRDGRLNHGGRWRTEEEWPLARTRYTSYYLHGDGGLDTTPPTGDEPSRSYQYDPKNPVPMIGGNISALVEIAPPIEGARDLGPMYRLRPIVEAGAFDQRERADLFGCKPPYLPLSSRHDILVYTSPPLDQDLEVTGTATVKLWASSSAVDTDFTAKLIDVYPPNPDYPEGYAMNLSDSIIRARYRRSRDRAELMEPGETYEFTIVLYPTSNLFKAGHQIRLDISSSNYPRFDLNPNTGEPLGKSTKTMVAENTIHNDADHPSHIILPIIP
ncbi:MAG: CocE/NonD family hydrolase [Candidatus Bathyarchaeia archaeon]